MKILLFLTTLLVGSMTVMAQDARIEKNRFFVKLKKGSHFPAIKNAKSIKKLFGDVYLVNSNNIDLATQELKAKHQVKFIENSFYAKKGKLEEPSKSLLMINPGETPFDDPKADRLWAFRDADKGGMDVNKAYFEPLPFTKTEVIVAVVDTGVDYNHEELKNVMWRNVDEIPGNGIDDDNNGYIDDVYGINTLVRDSEGNATTDPKHSHAHGTHVSGTIAAEQNNGIGISGVASNVKIMAIRTVPDTRDETDVDIVEAFIYAAKNGAKIINCSFGKNHNEGGMIVSEAIKYIGENYGVLVIASAGNDYQRDIDVKIKYPASFANDHLMVVASTKSGGGLSTFSNIGIVNVDVAAPGSAILSTIPGNQYNTYDGTSMAAPNTAGVAAEVLSHFPELGPLELKKLLMDSVEKTKQLETKISSGGIVNLYNALQMGLQKY